MLLLLLILSLAVRLILINQSLWLDEAAQAIESLRPLGSQLDISADFQPPLFHLLLHFWMKIGGTHDVWLRLLPVLISVLSVYLVYLIVRSLYSKKIALFSTFLYSINPFAIYYSQELRPYPLSVFTALLAVLGLVKKSRLLMIVGITAFLYTTYFAPFFIFALFTYYFLYAKNQIKWFIENLTVCIILFLPWIPSFITQLKNGTGLLTVLPGWGEAVSTPVYKALPLVFIKFFIGRITIDNRVIYASVFSILLILFIYLLIKVIKAGRYKLTILLFIIPILLSWLTSFFIPVIDPKRLLFVVPFFCMILGIGIGLLKDRQKIISLVIILGVFLYGLFSYYTNPRFQREQWKEAVSFVENSGDGTQVVVFVFPDSFAPFQWYSNDSILSLAVAPEFVVRNIDVEMMIVSLENRERIYLFGYLTDLTDPEGKIKKGLELNGFINTDTYDFPGVGFIFQYDKAPLALAP